MFIYRILRLRLKLSVLWLSIAQLLNCILQLQVLVFGYFNLSPSCFGHLETVKFTVRNYLMCITFNMLKSFRNARHHRRRKHCLRCIDREGAQEEQKYAYVVLDHDYAVKFRKEAYETFWEKVRTVTGNKEEGNSRSTPTSRLPSYRSLVDRLLEPSQETVKQYLLSCNTNGRAHDKHLLEDYFSESFLAFDLCGIILKNVENARKSYRMVQKIPETLSVSRNLAESEQTFVLKQFAMFTEFSNPFSVFTEDRFQELQNNFGALYGKFERKRNALDDAAKATYVLERDLDTMSRLVTLLHIEMEHAKDMMTFCLTTKTELSPLQQVLLSLARNDAGFCHRLDELEEYVYLCLVSINVSRNVVFSKLLE